MVSVGYRTRGGLLNRQIAEDCEYKSFGELFVLSESEYFKGTLCKCWCECGSFVNVNKDDLVSGKRTDCGQVGHVKKEVVKRDRSRDYVNRRIKARYNLLLHNRKWDKYKIHLTLTEYAELAKTSECHYCGDEIDWLSKSSAYFLDRKDNSLGYSKDNCVVCCSRCNMSKGNRFTYEEWCELGKIIKSWKTNGINFLR